jgi:hypothetical protein
MALPFQSRSRPNGRGTQDDGGKSGSRWERIGWSRKAAQDDRQGSSRTIAAGTGKQDDRFRDHCGRRCNTGSRATGNDRRAGYALAIITVIAGFGRRDSRLRRNSSRRRETGDNDGKTAK